MSRSFSTTLTTLNAVNIPWEAEVMRLTVPFSSYSEVAALMPDLVMEKIGERYDLRYDLPPKSLEAKVTEVAKLSLSKAEAKPAKA